MSNDDTANVLGIIWLAVAATALIAVLVIGAFTLPFILAAVFIGSAIYKHYHSPQKQEERVAEQTRLLYMKAKAHFDPVLDKHDFGGAVYERTPSILPDKLADNLLVMALELYDLESFNELPPPPAICNSIEGARYRDFLSAQMAKQNTNAVGLAVDCIVESTTQFYNELPSIPTEGNLGTVSFSDFARNKPQLIQALIFGLYSGEASTNGLFKSVRNQLNNNLCDLSGIPRNEPDHSDLIMPEDYDGDEDIIEAYLKHTPLIDVFDFEVPLGIPEEVRFEATWVIGRQGTGKTQLIQSLIASDLEKVANDECSIVVIDSQNDLIKTIGGLRDFAPGGRLEDKLVSIKPDLNYPPALNIFDMGRDRINAYSENDREKFTTIAIDQINYVLDALMGEGGTMTPKQTGLFRYLCRLMMEIPEANLMTFADMLKITSKDKKALEPYQKYIDKLHEPAQDFFASQFFDRDYDSTKQQVAWRISNLRENTYFDRMFSHPKSKLDLFTELNSSKVILINTDQEHLGSEGTNIFGRYFLGALLSASQERAGLHRSERKPVYIYIDEAHDYIADDSKIANLIDQARKMRIALLLAHQRTKQIQLPTVLDALSNTSIQFANTNNANDLKLLPQTLNTTAEFISSQPKFHFALHVSGQPTFSYKVPVFLLENMPKMENEERKVVYGKIRERYTSPYRTAKDRGEEERTSEVTRSRDVSSVDKHESIKDRSVKNNSSDVVDVVEPHSPDNKVPTRPKDQDQHDTGDDPDNQPIFLDDE